MALALGAMMLAAAPMRAEPIYGTFQTQYQRIDDRTLLLGGDGTLRMRTMQQEIWLRTLDVHHQTYPRNDVLVESNLRFADQALLGTGNQTRTPMGSLRVIHPFLQLVALHQPATQISSLSAQSGLSPDSITTRRVTSHNRETLINSHVAVPGWPQLDASWVLRVREGAGSVGDRNNVRNVRASYDRGPWSAYGGLNDQVMSSGTSGSSRSTQQVWNAGGAYHYLARQDLTTHAQFDATTVRGVGASGRRPSVMNQSGSLSGEWRPSAKWLATANYQIRHVDLGLASVGPQTDHESALIGRYLVSSKSSLLAGAGLRTVRNFLPEGGSSEALQKYLTGLATVEARARRRWTMTAGLSHTTNFDPGRAAYHVETITGSSRGQLTRTIQLDGTLQFAATSDSGSVANRYSNAWTARVQATPLRALQGSVSIRGQRSGPGLLRPVSASRGLVADANWRPTPQLQLLGQYGVSTILGVGTSTSSRSLSARYQPGRRWQWYGSYSRSDQRVIVSTAGQLSSREVVTSRVQYERSRRLAMSAGVTYNDPGRALESKRLDLALTWSFGR